MQSKKRKIFVRIIVVISIIMTLLLFILPFGLAVFIYEDNFGDRYELYAPTARRIDDFEGLNSQRYTFESNKGQTLVGYKYHKTLEPPKGLVVIAHGLGGGGHNPYLEVVDYFASNGYAVFAYDATGNNESEGNSVKGLPQGLIDLNYVLDFIYETSDFDGLPVMLFGHSWGAYSAGSVLNLHPEVKAVVMVAGFNQSMDIIMEEGRRIAGDVIDSLLPYLSLYERLKFGKYSSYTCIQGFNKSEAGVMIIHSSDDAMISSDLSYDIFYELYQDNPRFHFINYDNRGHDYVYYSDAARAYKDQFNQGFQDYVNSLEGDLTPELKASYLQEHLDKKTIYELDQDLMDRILRLYDSYAK